MNIQKSNKIQLHYYFCFLDDEVVDRQLVGARSIGRRSCIHALARPHQLVETAVDRQVVVRDRLLRLRQPVRDRLPHARQADASGHPRPNQWNHVNTQKYF